MTRTNFTTTEKFDYFFIQGETQRCESIIRQGEHALIGISPFNSRFSKEYVTSLILFIAERFSHVDILMPCVKEASRLLIASGVEEKKAIKKTERELRRHKKHINALFLTPALQKRKINIIQFSDYAKHPKYLSMKQELEVALTSCERFKRDCLTMSRLAVKGRMKGTGRDIQVPDSQLIKQALPYILAELPFFLNTPSLLGVKYSTLFYHRPWPIARGLYDGTYPIQVNIRQSYAVVTLKEEKFHNNKDN
jgi:cyclo(L-leucyl-L-leucyl) synthase